MFPIDRSGLRRSRKSTCSVALLAASVVLVLGAMVGCGGPEVDVVGGAVESTPAAPATEPSANDASSSDAPASGSVATDGSADAAPPSSEPGEPIKAQPGEAEKTELPAADGIEGCEASSCSVSDAVTYEHLYQGPVTVVLFADYSEDSLGACRVAVLDSDGNTAQIFPLQDVTAWSKRDSELAEIFYFLDPPTDATQNVFFHMPDGDGWMASGLVPSSAGYFELFDLGYIADDFSEQFDSEPMVALDWGDLDAHGNYQLEIDGVVTEWDGKKYVAS